MAEGSQIWVSDYVKGMENGLEQEFVQWLRLLRLLSKAFDKAIVPLPHHSYDISNPKIMGELVSGDPNNIKVRKQYPVTSTTSRAGLFIVML
jgi:hypothetical protein